MQVAIRPGLGASDKLDVMPNAKATGALGLLTLGDMIDVAGLAFVETNTFLVRLGEIFAPVERRQPRHACAEDNALVTINPLRRKCAEGLFGDRRRRRTFGHAA